MKKLMIPMLALLLAAMLCAGASANSWGLSGDLYLAVEQSGAWDDYTLLGNQAGDFAVLQSRYHNALFYAETVEDLHVYTAAVYQPEDGKPAPRLEVNDDFDLTISYGDSESYTFALTVEGYELTEAVIGDFRLRTTESDDDFYSWNYSAEDGEETAAFPVTIMLDTFNIRLFPHSAAEVRNINHMRALLELTRYCLGFGSDTEEAYSPDRRGELLQPKKEGTVPVYSAPSAKSWRAGKGKAAVGTNGSLWVLKRAAGSDGKAWACIRYDVSERTQRIGWALCRDLGLPEETEDPGFVQTKVQAASDTFLTDDPDVSQYAQFTVAKGTELTCLGLYNDSYAYVEAKEKNNKLSGKGSAVRGFVPLKDLQPAPAKVQTALMKKAAGVWYADGGGALAGDLLTLNKDGTFVSGRAGSPDDEDETLEGTWYVTRYDPAEGMYWDEPKYRATFLYNDGRAGVFGMSLTNAHLNLTLGNDGASYGPFDDYDDYGDYDDYDDTAEDE